MDFSNFSKWHWSRVAIPSGNPPRWADRAPHLKPTKTSYNSVISNIFHVSVKRFQSLNPHVDSHPILGWWRTLGRNNTARKSSVVCVFSLEGPFLLLQFPFLLMDSSHFTCKRAYHPMSSCVDQWPSWNHQWTNQKLNILYKWCCHKLHMWQDITPLDVKWAKLVAQSVHGAPLNRSLLPGQPMGVGAGVVSCVS